MHNLTCENILKIGVGPPNAMYAATLEVRCEVQQHYKGMHSGTHRFTVNSCMTYKWNNNDDYAKMDDARLKYRADKFDEALVALEHNPRHGIGGEYCQACSDATLFMDRRD